MPLAGIEEQAKSHHQDEVQKNNIFFTVQHAKVVAVFFSDTKVVHVQCRNTPHNVDKVVSALDTAFFFSAPSAKGSPIAGWWLGDGTSMTR